MRIKIKEGEHFPVVYCSDYDSQKGVLGGKD
jgi:hypothetical protein